MDLGDLDGGVDPLHQPLADIDLARSRHRIVMPRFYRLYVGDQLSADGFHKLHQPLEQRSKQLDESNPDLQGEIDFTKIQLLSSDEILVEAKDLYDRWPELTAEEKRVIVENVLERLTIGKDEVLIDLSYLPASSEGVAKSERSLSGW